MVSDSQWPDGMRSPESVDMCHHQCALMSHVTTAPLRVNIEQFPLCGFYSNANFSTLTFEHLIDIELLLLTKSCDDSDTAGWDGALVNVGLLNGTRLETDMSQTINNDTVDQVDSLPCSSQVHLCPVVLTRRGVDVARGRRRSHTSVAEMIMMRFDHDNETNEIYIY